jgi:hypothetical protein
VERVGGFDPFRIAGLTALCRELGRVAAVHLPEHPGGAVAVCHLLSFDGLEQPPADDLEALLGTGRSPGGFYPADHVAQAPQRLSAAGAADLRFRSCATVASVSPFGDWQGQHQHDAGGGSGGFGEGLGEAEVGVEVAGWEPLGVEQLAGVRDPLVNQDQAGAVPAEQPVEVVARVGCGPVGVSDYLIAVPAAQSPGELAPQGADLGSARAGLSPRRGSSGGGGAHPGRHHLVLASRPCAAHGSPPAAVPPPPSHHAPTAHPNPLIDHAKQAGPTSTIPTKPSPEWEPQISWR